MQTKRGKRRFVLKEEASKYSLALPSIIDSIKNLNRAILDKEYEVDSEKKRFNSRILELKELLQRREEVLKILKDLKLIKFSREKEEINGKNPSEAISLNNPDIEIFLSEKELEEAEEKEKEMEKRKEKEGSENAD